MLTHNIHNCKLRFNTLVNSTMQVPSNSLGD